MHQKRCRVAGGQLRIAKGLTCRTILLNLRSSLHWRRHETTAAHETTVQETL